MAKKDFDEYYNSILKQYLDLKKTLNDMSEEVENNLLEPERLEGIKNLIKPIKESCQTVTYIKYLLDKPSRKSKINKYNQRSHKLLKQSEGYTQKDIMNKNDEILKGLKGSKIWGIFLKNLE